MSLIADVRSGCGWVGCEVGNDGRMAHEVLSDYGSLGRGRWEMRRTVGILVVLLLSLFMGCQPAQTALPPFAFRGLVVDANGKPVEGAVIEVYATKWDASQTWRIIGDKCGEFRAGEGGRLYVPMEGKGTAGDAVLIARRQGLGIGWAQGPSWRNWYAAIVMGNPADLRCRVVDEANRPIQGAEVRAVGIARSLSGQMTCEALLPNVAPIRGVTDQNGDLTIRGLPADSFPTLLVSAKGKAGLLADLSTQKSAGGARIGSAGSPIVIKLLPEAVVWGRVQCPWGGPVEGTKVAVSPSSGWTSGGPAIADANGIFRVDRLPEGTCEFWLIQPEEHRLFSGRVTIDLAAGKQSSVVLKAETGDPFQVLVRDADTNRPISGLTCSVHGPINAAGGIFAGSPDANEEKKYTLELQTDANGIAKGYLPSGRYEVRASSLEYEEQVATGSVGIDATEERPAQVGMLLRKSIPEPRRMVCVRDEAGRPVPYAYLWCLSEGVQESTDDNGYASVRSPRGFLVSPMCAYHPWLDLAGACDWRPGTDEATIVLKPPFAAAGRVTDANGNPVGSARVSADIGDHKTTADANGFYRFPRLPGDVRWIFADANEIGTEGAKISFNDPNFRSGRADIRLGH